MMRTSLLTFAASCGVMIATMATASPIVSDSRIKTLVYNENDVYSLLTHYGYQSNIEFGKQEVVETVSVGDRVAWQIIPSGRRLFIKAMEEKAHTNMTVVTNKRAYQFDLRSSGSAPLRASEELVYVVRFFYPSEQQAPAAMWQAPQNFAPAPAPAMLQPAAMQQSPPMPAQNAVPGGSAPYYPMNYQYTLSGPDAIAPVQVFDDGRVTYLRFAQGFNAPIEVYTPQANGQLTALPVSRNAKGDMVVKTIQPRLLIQSGGQQVIIFNESMPSA